MAATFIVYVVVGDSVVPAHVIFPALALYDILRSSLALLLPWGVQHVLDAKAAIHRLQVCF